MPAKLRVTLVKSPIGHTRQTRATMRALGLRRIGDTVEIADTPELRGMVRAIRFLVQADEVSQNAARATKESSAKEESK